jgi:hypothetical protein
MISQFQLFVIFLSIGGVGIVLGFFNLLVAIRDRSKVGEHNTFGRTLTTQFVAGEALRMMAQLLFAFAVINSWTKAYGKPYVEVNAFEPTIFALMMMLFALTLNSVVITIVRRTLTKLLEEGITAEEEAVSSALNQLHEDNVEAAEVLKAADEDVTRKVKRKGGE